MQKGPCVPETFSNTSSGAVSGLIRPKTLLNDRVRVGLCYYQPRDFSILQETPDKKLLTKWVVLQDEIPWLRSLHPQTILVPCLWGHQASPARALKVFGYPPSQPPERRCGIGRPRTIPAV